MIQPPQRDRQHIHWLSYTKIQRNTQKALPFEQKGKASHDLHSTTQQSFNASRSTLFYAHSHKPYQEK